MNGLGKYNSKSGTVVCQKKTGTSCTENRPLFQGAGPREEHIAANPNARPWVSRNAGKEKQPQHMCTHLRRWTWQVVRVPPPWKSDRQYMGQMCLGAKETVRARALTMKPYKWSANHAKQNDCPKQEWLQMPTTLVSSLKSSARRPQYLRTTMSNMTPTKLEQSCLQLDK